MKTGDIVLVDPRLTSIDEWIEGTIIDIENNPFKGLVIAVKDKLDRVFFGEVKYFKLPNNQESCLQ